MKVGQEKCRGLECNPHSVWHPPRPSFLEVFYGLHSILSGEPDSTGKIQIICTSMWADSILPLSRCKETREHVGARRWRRLRPWKVARCHNPVG